MSTEPTRLIDYRPPAWRVRDVALRFELDFVETRVFATLQLERHPERDDGEALCLHGEDLQLRMLRLDGRALTADEYRIDAASLTIAGAPSPCTIETEVHIRPDKNTRLEGLYRSGSFLTTQCEAEGFRRITWFIDRPDVMATFRVRLEADRERFPVLLANGNPGESGRLPEGRHFAEWIDPWPKPSYLFAVVAGRLDCIEDHFRTMEGRDVRLRIYAEAQAIQRCAHAMDSLKRAMIWDEEQFGRAYDLDVFNIVATYDFNMGAMENKGLNIFNAKAIVADPETATDADLDYVEAVVAHEYFHNWTGNRVTCRDWFQLSLKEGLTVFRDQEFSADQGSRAVKRIDDVRQLRTMQFPEDAGPFAHPVRPAAYSEINNFYTSTVYDKGAEVVRLYRTLLGRDGFRRGMDLYFDRHDGQAVTCDDFLRAMADANGANLDALKLWYAQAGTPVLRAELCHDAPTRRVHLRLSQHTAPTPGQASKQPLPIPVRMMLYAPDGRPYPLRRAGTDTEAAEQTVLVLTDAVADYVFEDIDTRPVASLLQDFSAPVRLEFAVSDAELAFRIAHEHDDFNRFDAAQTLAERILLAAYRRGGLDASPSLAVLLDALAKLVADEHIDPALVAECLEPPDEISLGERIDALDPTRLHGVREALRAAIGQHLAAALIARREVLADAARGRYAATPVSARRFRQRALHLLMAADAAAHAPLARQQYADATAMGERLAALAALMHHAVPGAQALAETFHRRHADDQLLIDKWLMLQATNPQPGTLERVHALLDHAAFSLRNPNKVRSLLGSFARQNRARFHEASGAGYRLIGSQLAVLDAINPQIAARIAAVFNGWRRLEPSRAAMMRSELERLAAVPGLSRDTSEIVSRALAG
ncbi:MAG: aminopeptidase N [Xanthomonadales bacterium]|jgi:aminopeptidase N|nr:aminopeptidase N [Xanthomonadales bacterium]